MVGSNTNLVSNGDALLLSNLAGTKLNQQYNAVFDAKPSENPSALCYEGLSPAKYCSGIKLSNNDLKTLYKWIKKN